VGLGNPGPQYDKTRHNAGFWFVDELARRFRSTFHREPKFLGDTCHIHGEGWSVWLFKPGAYMNRSGLPIASMSNYYRLSPHHLLVVHDEIDLLPGIAKLKRSGGPGGHNGLRDIIAHLGKDFWRLRLGVGHPGHRNHVIDYVLSPPNREQDELIHQGIDRTLTLIPLVIGGDMEQAMHKLHSKPEKPSNRGQQLENDASEP
jgi:PTH1 family peptidyl-tRNA hydrolase